MEARFQAIAENGSLLVDSDWPSMVLVQKGTISVGSNTAPEGMWGSTYWSNPRGGQSIVFLRGSGFAAVTDCAPTGFSWYFAKGVTTCNYYAFVPVMQAQGRVGLQLFDAQGTITYDATQRPLRIRQVISAGGMLIWPDSGGVGTIVPFSLVNPGSAAIAFSDPGMYSQYLTGTPVGSPIWRSPANVCMRINGSNLEIAACQSITNVNPGSGVAISSRSGIQPQLLFECDVTGL
ncbi:hypothetical protein KK141_13920 [Dyella sp. LX-66]|uniref:hypothetical protein n=1 Tax=unclassified Dyella TaxID=2634549 RepID=UPI001BE11495|nr:MULTISPECIES: hypothetical protein [unclassified Dyella]MBT2116419.1 hypothetical protein [Dyella sp. LX-1]MBT2140638.1 hypothetical protein [Dyella sp. LX-66]